MSVQEKRQHDVSEATHYLRCSHVYNGKSRHSYLMKCLLLGTTTGGKAKVLVFGYRYFADTYDVQRVRYVPMGRLTSIVDAEGKQ